MDRDPPPDHVPQRAVPIRDLIGERPEVPGALPAPAAGSAAPPGRAAAAAPAPRDQAPLRAALLGLPDLYFKPRRFFARAIRIDTSVAMMLCAWLYGTARLIDGTTQRAGTGDGLVSGDSWLAFWPAVALGGVLSGIISLTVGTWWYRLRLRWSGAADPDRDDARQVYLYASIVWALPVVIATVADTVRFASPLEAWSVFEDWEMLLLVLPLWSTITSFAGATAVFDVRRLPAVLWFVVLPNVVNLIALAVFLSIIMPTGADVDHPLRHDGDTLSFSYPGNWTLAPAGGAGELGNDIIVEPPEDGVLRVMLYESVKSLDRELEVTLENYRGSFPVLDEQDGFDRWAAYGGLGRSFAATVDGEAYTVNLFVGDLGDGIYLETHEIFAGRNEAAIMPGLELVRRTFWSKVPMK